MLNLSSVGSKTEPRTFSYDWKDLALYALGIGATTQELDYVYEARGPRVLPTFAVVPAMEHLFACLGLADVPIASVVHGAQRVLAHQQAPSKATVTTTAEVTAIYDLKRFAQVVVSTDTRLPSGEPLWDTEWSVIVRGAGGFGGAPPPRSDEGAIPQTPATWSHEQITHAEQALLYRLSGDTNPLHIDPEAARAVGFERGPILHGLATFGFAARAIIATACAGDASRLREIRGQFRKPVWPGDTLVTQVWQGEPGTLAYQVRVKERDEIVLSNAWARVRVDE
ncbi:MAG: MaoC family dehydratase N-terminal domain-containing protein [Deltaproteobacteria bacterium]|nr:MaoC family dehydratase N-terminal domain-containing protein [Deltaproteobacteria bacterium]